MVAIMKEGFKLSREAREALESMGRHASEMENLVKNATPISPDKQGIGIYDSKLSEYFVDPVYRTEDGRFFHFYGRYGTTAKFIPQEKLDKARDFFLKEQGFDILQQPEE